MSDIPTGYPCLIYASESERSPGMNSSDSPPARSASRGAGADGAGSWPPERVTASTPAAGAVPVPRRAVLGLAPLEVAAFIGLLALALGPALGLLVRVWSRGGVVAGGDGFYVADTMQYLNWIAQSAEHVAVANLYDFAPPHHVFVHPGVVVSGLLHRAGLGLVAAWWLWKPVAVVTLFAGVRALAHRHLRVGGDRALALWLGLFYCSPLLPLFGWTSIGGPIEDLRVEFVTGETWIGLHLWGYLFTAIAVGLLPLALIAYERGRVPGGGRALALASAAGLTMAWLQPWQGATFIVVVLVAEGVCVVRRERAALHALRTACLPLVATALPLAYYLVLSLADEAWRMAGTANAIPRWAWWVTAIGLVPLLPAVLAYRVPARDFGSVALRVWPVGALALFLAPFGTFPAHFWQGIQIPLSVLVVIAWRERLGTRHRSVLAAIGAVVLLAGIGTVYRVDALRKATRTGGQPYYLTDGEHAALRWIGSRRGPGGVLTPVYLGNLVPAYAERATWVGATSWSPDFVARARAADRLYAGDLGTAEGAAVVRASGARFLLADCRGPDRMARYAAALGWTPARFGCATVYEAPGGSRERGGSTRR